MIRTFLLPVNATYPTPWCSVWTGLVDGVKTVINMEGSTPEQSVQRLQDAIKSKHISEITNGTSSLHSDKVAK